MMENLEDSFISLFKESRYSDIIARSEEQSITPQSAPLAARVLAASYFQIGDFSQAYLLLSQLEAALGKDPDFLSLYAATARRQGQLQKAEELFQTALEIDPDSPVTRNNYANLLIDLHKYDDALTILDSILEQNPDYRDAIFNRSRLKEILSSSNTDGPQSSSVNTSSSSLYLNETELDDPLLMAFEQDEINYSNQRYFNDRVPSNTEKPLTNLPQPNANAVANDQLRFAESALKNGDHSLVLKICSNAHAVLGAESKIYDLASDAYLALNRITQAENCLLHAFAISGPSLKRCLNLANFSMMRGNLILAEYYLSQAKAIDPSSGYIKKIRETLTSQQKNSTSPFIFQKDWAELSAARKND